MKASLFPSLAVFIQNECFRGASVPVRPRPTHAFVNGALTLRIDLILQGSLHVHVALASLNLACHYAIPNAGQIGGDSGQTVSSYKRLSAKKTSFNKSCTARKHIASEAVRRLFFPLSTVMIHKM